MNEPEDEQRRLLAEDYLRTQWERVDRLERSSRRWAVAAAVLASLGLLLAVLGIGLRLLGS